MKKQKDQQDIQSELAHAYVYYLETGNGDPFDELKPKAKELGVDLEVVCYRVREARNLAALTKKYEDDPEMFRKVKPSLLERFLGRRKESR